MKKSAFYFMFLVLSLHINTQNTFFNIFNTHQIETSFDAILSSDGSLIIVGKRSTTTYEEDVCGLIMKVDENGNFIKEITLASPNRTYYYNIEKVPNYDNEFIIIGSSDSIVGQDLYSSIMITRIDDQLNVISRHSFRPIKNYRITPWKLAFINDSTMILEIGRQVHAAGSPPLSLMITEVKLPAHSIRSFFSDSTIFRIPGDIIYIPKSDEIHITYYGPSIDNDTSNLKILRLDHLLNKIETLQSPSCALTTACSTKLTDSSYLLTATSYVSINYNTVRAISAFEMDAYGNGLKGIKYYNHPDTILYGGFGVNAAIVNGSIFLTGIYNIDPWGVPWQSTPTWIQITKLDMDLNILGDYFYGGDAAYYPYCILPTRDNGAFITGIIWDFQLPKQLDIFAMKVNSDGIIVNVPGNIPLQMAEAIIYPNPASTRVSIDFSKMYVSAYFRLTDISGKVIMEEHLNSNRQTLDISALPAGTYIYRIFNPKGLGETGKLVVE